MSDWQPIYTAPLDGTRVLVQDLAGNISIAYWQPDPHLWERENVPCWAEFEAEDYFYSRYLLDGYAPEYWQPLPEPKP